MSRQVTFKPSDEVVDQFEKLFEAAKAENPLLSKPKFFEMMVSRYATPSPKSDIVPDGSYKILADKQTEYFNDIADLLNLKVENYSITDIFNEIRATQQRAMAALQSQNIPDDYQRPLKENEIIFSIPDIHLKLLNEVTRRLSTDESRVTIKDILLDMFLRYEVQRYNEWFYPMVIKDDEFLAITGYERKELKKLCQQ